MGRTTTAGPAAPRPPKPRRVRRAIRRFEVVLTAHWPGLSRSSVPPDFLLRSTTSSEPAPEVAATAATSGAGSSKPKRRLPPGIRHLAAVFAAVYAALSDPLVGPDDEARERRAAQVRRAGMYTAAAAAATVLIYATFPVRTYLDQRAATQRARERIEVISRENERLAERAEDLRDPETVEEIARRDYGLVFPGEESYGVLPPPAETTTTAPTTTITVPP